MRHSTGNERLTISQADNVLQNILSSCDMPPNSIPFTKIGSVAKSHVLFFKTCIIIGILALLITFLSPIPFLLIDNKVNSSANSRDGIAITNDYLEDGVIYLQLSVTVEPDVCCLTLADGKTIAPVSYDSLKKMISFPYTDEVLSIYLETPEGMSATVIVTPK